MTESPTPTPGTVTRYLYAYDGSGVPMSTAVTVHEIRDDDGMALVSFDRFNPPVDLLVEEPTEIEEFRWVPAVRLGSDFPLASFGWLD